MLTRLLIALTLLSGPMGAAAADNVAQLNDTDAFWFSDGSPAYPPGWLLTDTANSAWQEQQPLSTPLSVSYRQESWLSRVANWGQNLRLTLWRNSESELTLGLSSRGLKFRLRGDSQGGHSGERDLGAHQELLTTQSLFRDSTERIRP